MIYPGCCALDVVGPADVFATANQLSGEPLYRCSVAGPTLGAVTTESAVMLESARLVADVGTARDPAHTVIVSGGLGSGAAIDDAGFVGAINRLATHSTRIGSVCTGSFLLAEAGLLDGRRATTHWAHADAFRARYPTVDLDPDALYVADGPIVTAAGVAAGIDMALALVAADHSPGLAQRVSRRMVVYLHRSGGQSQFSERTDPHAAGDADLAPALAAVAVDPAADHSVRAMAIRASMTERTFARRFKQATGTTPARWVERARIDHARERLEATADPLTLIATRSGFASPVTMSQAFVRVVGLSPNQYRRQHAATSSGRPHPNGRCQ